MKNITISLVVVFILLSSIIPFISQEASKYDVYEHHKLIIFISSYIILLGNITLGGKKWTRN
jgi:hypothetical protein